MIDYKIAIRSYKREELIKNKTLRILEEDNIPKKNIYIFCGTKEINKYKKSLGNGYNILDGGDKGTNFCNKKIIDYFHKNEYIIQCDDDINMILQLKKDKTRARKKMPCGRIEPLGLERKNILELIEEGKSMMDDNFYNLWGLYPVNNYYFMKDETSLDLRFCIGRIFGFNNTKDVVCGDDMRDDYERSILYYDRDGGIIRFNNYVCDADTYSSKGGLAEMRDIEKMEKSCSYMEKTYPNYVRKKNCKSKYREIRLVS